MLAQPVCLAGLIAVPNTMTGPFQKVLSDSPSIFRLSSRSHLGHREANSSSGGEQSASLWGICEFTLLWPFLVAEDGL